ncbi:hypothetical protein MLD52_07100 [Puniceicoccaceae bacterium K14]|nr:hypothetical protein [Puniceicoccaceae bacterium K14]
MKTEQKNIFSRYAGHSAIIATVLSTGCYHSEVKQTPEISAAMTTQQNDALRAHDWSAWVENGQLRLTGKIDFPSPGYHTNWCLGPLDRAFPPGLRIILEIEKPTNPTIPVITTKSFDLSFESPAPEYREIVLVYGEVQLSRIQSLISAQ